MDASERVSWADCPNCGGLVAVGWLDGDPVAVDCAAGCRLPAARGGRPDLRGQSRPCRHGR
jgi:hypothetical protein